MGFNLKHSSGAQYYVIDEMEQTGKVKTCFSTRIGGISPSPFDSLNLGYKTGDDKSNVDDNFKIICRAAGFNINDLVLSDQIHENVYRIVDIEDRGKGIMSESDIIGVDSLITNKKDVALCIFTADCVPIFLFDIVKGVIALCHAGWRGIVKGIIPKTLNAMVETFNCSVDDMTAAIGPSIGPCCFTVGADVAEQFKNIFEDTEGIIIRDDHGININLWNAAINQLVLAGVKRGSIINSEICTSCNNATLYSYRKDENKTGRMVSIIQLI